MLLNFWTRRVGLNQLSSTFYPTFEVVGDDALDVIPNKLHLIKKNKRTISIKKLIITVEPQPIEPMLLLRG
jgi:hypothetical protein